jgi:uncharacterized protein (DUF302 family)
MMNLPHIGAFRRRARHVGRAALVVFFAAAGICEAASMRIEKSMISVEHVEIQSDRSFDEVARRLEAAVPAMDPAIQDALASNDRARAEKLIDHAPLFLFLKRDHGAILAVTGRERKAFQYEIGNALTATRMTRHKLGASLYAPLRVTLFEDGNGCVFAYDQPSSLFGQFGDEEISAVARDLDEKLKAALLRAAE